MHWKYSPYCHKWDEYACYSCNYFNIVLVTIQPDPSQRIKVKIKFELKIKYKLQMDIRNKPVLFKKI